MKKITLFVLGIAFSISALAQQKATISLKESVVNWSGSQLFTVNKHHGTVNFKEGFLLFENNKIVGGDFVIDMNSITNTDGEFNDGLVGHLKNEDFFDVPKYPTARLKITYVQHHWVGSSMTITADLTIKGITKSIQFAAQTDKGIIAKLVIDRSKWDIKYKSQSFFKNLGDETISDEIVFDVKIALNGC